MSLLVCISHIFECTQSKMIEKEGTMKGTKEVMKDGMKKRKKQNRENWGSYIAKVLKTVHEEGIVIY